MHGPGKPLQTKRKGLLVVEKATRMKKRFAGPRARSAYTKRELLRRREKALPCSFVPSLKRGWRGAKLEKVDRSEAPLTRGTDSKKTEPRGGKVKEREKGELPVGLIAEVSGNRRGKKGISQGASFTGKTCLLPSSGQVLPCSTKDEEGPSGKREPEGKTLLQVEILNRYLLKIEGRGGSKTLNLRYPGAFGEYSYYEHLKKRKKGLSVPVGR